MVQVPRVAGTGGGGTVTCQGQPSAAGGSFVRAYGAWLPCLGRAQFPVLAAVGENCREQHGTEIPQKMGMEAKLDGH